MVIRLLATRDFGALLRRLRALTGWSQQRLANEAGLAQNTVSQLETGKRLMSDINAIIAVLDDLDVPDQLRPQLTSRTPRRAHVDHVRIRRSSAPAAGAERGPASGVASDGIGSATQDAAPIFTASLLASTPTSLAEVLAALAPNSGPAAVAASEIAQVHETAALLKSMDALHGGGGRTLEIGMQQLHKAAELLNLPCSEQLRPKLLVSVARLGAVVGQSAFDAVHHVQARQVFSLAVDCAEQADDWGMRAYVYSWISRQETWCGAPDAALTAAELGLVRADRLTPVEQAWLLNAQARAFAAMGRTQETLAAVGASDDAYSRSDLAKELERPWMAFYDGAQHVGDTGHALYELAVAGHNPAPALERLQQAVDTHAPTAVRSRTFSGTRLAHLLLTLDPQHGAQAALSVLERTGELNSGRVVHDLRSLYTSASSLHRSGSVADLRDRIKETLTGA